MQTNGRARCTRCWIACGAILGTLVLTSAVLLLGKAMLAAPSKQSSAESAPWVKPAVDGVLDLFQHKSVVALADDHGLAQEEVFYSALVRDARFAEQVGNVVVEFGGEASQDI